MLVKGPAVQPNYCYQPASEQTRARVTAMEQACRSFGVPLAAAALQFSLRHPGIASTMVGMSAPDRIKQTLELAAWPIPDELWQELEVLTQAGRHGVF